MSSSGNTIHRITCAVREGMTGRVAELLNELSIPEVLIENARSVRRRRRGRWFGFSGGYVEHLEDAPIELFQFSVLPEASQGVMEKLVQELAISHPGRGTVFVQEANEFIARPSNPVAESVAAPPSGKLGFLQDLALITCITSMQGSGQELARLALELGAGVPIVTLGSASGVRDRLGLLRITVPPRKELVHLLVPELDVEGVLRLLVEKGRLNRPGKGFVYSSSVLRGLLDTSMQLGPQESSASIEQMIAAIDELKANTAWRRRIADPQDSIGLELQKKCVEISLVCPEEGSSNYVEAALQAGAEGATITKVRQRMIGQKNAALPCERAVIIVPRQISGQVVDALMTADQNGSSQLRSLQTHDAPMSFSHRPRMVNKQT